MQDLTGPVFLTDPMNPEALEPAPTPGCLVCAALAKQREDARNRSDASLVSDCNVEPRRHPHSLAKAQRKGSTNGDA